MAVRAKPGADRHIWSVQTSTFLSRLYVANFIAPEDVIRVLNAAKISFTLVEAHGIGGWTRMPRATEDVDIVVTKRQVKNAIAALTTAFPNLDADDQEVVVRLPDRETGAVRIDIMKPVQPVIQAALKQTHAVKSGRQSHKVPSLEMALALKFGPMVSLNRAEVDKYQDASDFGRMVLANPNLDLPKLATLGDFVYPGGGAEILEMVRRIRVGEKLSL